MRPSTGSVTTGRASPFRLRSQSDLFGVLAVYYREPRPFSDEDVRLAQSFGDQAALAIENARLREQMERSAVAAERSRLARDLHDSVTQSLFAASIQAEALRCKWRPTSEEAQRSLEDVERLTRGALAEMRTLLLEMRPAALAQSPLHDLLRHLVDATEARYADTREALDRRAADNAAGRDSRALPHRSGSDEQRGASLQGGRAPG